LFLVEKRGTIRIIRDVTLLPGQFVNLVGQVSTGGEQGLLGMAFDPNYAANRRFYVNDTNLDGDTVIARFLADAVDPDATPATLDRVLLTVSQPFANHNGGMLAFGPEGFLHIGLGDGGSGGDPDNRAQNLDDLLGKMLRIDVSHATHPVEYSIPPDNPFAVGGGKPEIWSLGLRNPWRYSFDRQTGDLYLADVGQGSREEVNVSPLSSGGGRGLN
jgi:glucose/arabinose dehydrogenase